MYRSFTSYRITGLEPGNRYTINVTAFNVAGNGPVSNSITAITNETSKKEPIHTSICSLIIFFTAPSGSPTSVRVTRVTASSITVQWGEVHCLNRNGKITGYTAQAVRNGVVEGTTNVSGSTATLSGLSPSTSYTVKVAAVNGAGTGTYSSTTPIRTSGK